MPTTTSKDEAMTIEDMIKSGAIIEHKTIEGARTSLTVARPLSDEEKKVWERYREGQRLGRAP